MFNNYINLIMSSLILIAVLMILGLVALTNKLDDRIYGNNKVLLIVILSLYALFRGYRMVKMFKRKQE